MPNAALKCLGVGIESGRKAVPSRPHAPFHLGFRRKQVRGAFAAGLVLLVVAGCGEKPATPAKPAEPPAKAGAGNPLTAPVDYLGAVGAAQKQAVKTLDLTQLTQAIRAFEAGEERLPSNLQELVSEGYLPKLPTPPKGMQFAYDARSGQVRIVAASR